MNTIILIKVKVVRQEPIMQCQQGPYEKDQCQSKSFKSQWMHIVVCYKAIYRFVVIC